MRSIAKIFFPLFHEIAQKSFFRTISHGCALTANIPAMACRHSPKSLQQDPLPSVFEQLIRTALKYHPCLQLGVIVDSQNYKQN